jgi:hypothetical protein
MFAAIFRNGIGDARLMFFWALDVDISAVRVQVKGASEHLSGLLLNDYCRQPHVTLDLCGFPSSAPNDDDEFNHALIDRQCSALRAAHVPAFDMFVGGLGSFSSAPFCRLPIVPGNCSGARLPRRGWPASPAWPSCAATVGLYADAWPVTNIAARFEQYVAGEPVHCRIERISLMSYVPSLIGGELSSVADFIWPQVRCAGIALSLRELHFGGFSG